MAKAKRKPQRARPADRSLLLLALLAGLCVVVAGLYGWFSPGTYQDDDIDRFFLSQRAWVQPELFLDRWAMPIPVLLFALPARLFGYGGVEWTTALLSGLAVFIIGLAARNSGSRWPWLAGAFFFLQPIVLELSFSALAEPAGALLVAALLWAWSARRHDTAMLMAGLLPLARIDLGVLSLIAAGVCWKHASWWGRAAVLAPGLVWNGLGFLATGEPLFVLSGSHSKPLNSLGVWIYAKNAIIVVGAVVLFFFVFAVVERLRTRREAVPSDTSFRFPGLALVLAVVHWILLTLLAWDALPVGRSVGFLRHVAASAPALALVAAWGAERWITTGVRGLSAALLSSWVALSVVLLSHRLLAHTRITEGRDESRWILGAALLFVGLALSRRPLAANGKRIVSWGVVLLAGVLAFSSVRPIPLNAERKAIQTVIDRLAEFGVPLDQVTVYCNHPWFPFLAQRDRYDKVKTPPLTRETLERTDGQSLILWDNHYGPRLYGDIPLEALRTDPRFEELFTVWGGEPDTFRVVGFRRVR